MSKLKWIGLVVGLLILLPLAPLLAGIWAAYKIVKSTTVPKKWLLTPAVVLLSLVINSFYIRLFSPTTSTSSPTSSSNQVAGSAAELDDLQAAEVATATVSPSEPIVGESAVVARVIDGDTLELENGAKVRLIGIDTPETVDPRQSVQCFGRESSAKTTALLAGQTIVMHQDVSETDRYGRLLRYVYLDGVFINELLVRDGYAQASAYPPDIKYQDLFASAQAEAQAASRGLWGSLCATTPTLSPTPRPLSPTSPVTSSPPPSTGSWNCDCSKPCSAISSCAEAQYLLNSCGCSARDGDGDGIACDGAPLRCQR